ncbi:hypothetical protein GJ744_005667 [Endocarpon pusillum]|uniref:Carboxypeptidase n=1 Tax=Endocarpon pusillum TaxID=364733 RepID=A0A8H7AC22_9EURO|nr:hypothetical protein GJ744_005667 [Endocarpon pusillum]
MIYTAWKSFAILAAATATTIHAQLPAEVTDFKTMTGPDGRTLRFREPGLCETTEGVKSYSGFIDLAENKHLFFWFFESRHDPTSDPITLWLNGGPGSDSMYGLFDELGPCMLKADLSTEHNAFAWNEVSNMLFLSQPVGVGFSYGSKEEITVDLAALTNGTVNGTAEARYPVADYQAINSTNLAAVDAWDAIQQFYVSLPDINPEIRSNTFHLATESYGGHWGPVFMNHFRKQNDLHAEGNTSQKHHLDLGTLIIINGVVDYKTQAPAFPRFARNNTHGREVNDTVADQMEFSLRMKQGCLDYIDLCEATALSLGEAEGASLLDDLVCNTASSLCRNAVELVYVQYSPTENSPYDVRDHSVYPQPASAFPAYLNMGEVQQALGVDTNYSAPSNSEVLTPFWFTGDFVRSYPLSDLVELLDSGTRVALIYGDADYVCNWYGGEDLSLAANFSWATQFRNAGYAPLVVDGERYGDTREYGNFSFTRVFDAGHLVPFYQPEAALAMFNRTIHGLDIATGEQKIHDDYHTIGDAKSTYSQKDGNTE